MDEIKKLIAAFKEGYPFRTQLAEDEFDFIAVDNPNHKPDDGTNPYWVCKVKDFLTELQKELSR